MPVLDNLTTLIRKARNANEDSCSGPSVLNIEALRSAPRLTLPVKDTSAEEIARSDLFEEGLHLARQDAWSILGERIRTSDAARKLTPRGRDHCRQPRRFQR